MCMSQCDYRLCSLEIFMTEVNGLLDFFHVNSCSQMILRNYMSQGVSGF